MRISLAMAVRDGERHLGPLLASLARQTAPPHELVVTDDASTDATPTLLRSFARTAPFPVRLERSDERRGHAQTFIASARLCGGEAIAFCDQDDVWDDRKLERCGAELERSGATLLLHTTRVVDAELGDTGRRWPALGHSRVVPPLGLAGLGVHAPGMAMVVRRDVLSAADFDSRPRSRYGLGRQMLHDEWVLFLAGVLGPIHVLDEPLVLYRQHEANDSGGWVRARRRATLRPVIDDYEHAAAHTAACAEYLERNLPEDAAGRDRFAAAAGAYRRMSQSWTLRAALYRARGRQDRVRLLGRLVRARAYRPRSAGGLGRAALGKDLVAGLALHVRADA